MNTECSECGCVGGHKDLCRSREAWEYNEQIRSGLQAMNAGLRTRVAELEGTNAGLEESSLRNLHTLNRVIKERDLLFSQLEEATMRGDAAVNAKLELEAVIANPAPINMILHCPNCTTQHIDEQKGEWTNPPHRSHQCQVCDHIWRPADVPTNGVVSVQTKGQHDSPPSTFASETFAAVAWLHNEIENNRRHFEINTLVPNSDPSVWFLCEFVDGKRLNIGDGYSLVEAVAMARTGKKEQKLMNRQTPVITFPRPCNVVTTKLKNRRVKIARGLNGYGITLKSYEGGREIRTTKFAMSDEAMLALIANYFRLTMPEKCQCGAALTSPDTLEVKFAHAGPQCGYEIKRFVEGPTIDLEKLTADQRATSMAPYGWIVWEKK